jgi:hypothetical protein
MVDKSTLQFPNLNPKILKSETILAIISSNKENKMTKNQHWNDIFTSKETSELGWYEEDVSQTIKFLDLLEEKNELQVFLSGAGTSLLVDALLEKNHKLIFLKTNSGIDFIINIIHFQNHLV